MGKARDRPAPSEAHDCAAAKSPKSVRCPKKSTSPNSNLCPQPTSPSRSARSPSPSAACRSSNAGVRLPAPACVRLGRTTPRTLGPGRSSSKRTASAKLQPKLRLACCETFDQIDTALSASSTGHRIDGNNPREARDGMGIGPEPGRQPWPTQAGGPLGLGKRTERVCQLRLLGPHRFAPPRLLNARSPQHTRLCRYSITGAHVNRRVLRVTSASYEPAQTGAETLGLAGSGAIRAVLLFPSFRGARSAARCPVAGGRSCARLDVICHAMRRPEPFGSPSMKQSSQKYYRLTSGVDWAVFAGTTFHDYSSPQLRTSSGNCWRPVARPDRHEGRPVFNKSSCQRLVGAKVGAQT